MSSVWVPGEEGMAAGGPQGPGSHVGVSLHSPVLLGLCERLCLQLQTRGPHQPLEG